LPCAGFCETSELLTVPCILIGNRQLLPDATSMSPVEFSPQSASVADIEQFGAVRANDTDVKLGAPTSSAKAAILDNRIVDFLIFMRDAHRPKFTQVRRLELRAINRLAQAIPVRFARLLGQIPRLQWLLPSLCRDETISWLFSRRDCQKAIATQHSISLSALAWSRIPAPWLSAEIRLCRQLSLRQP
jgi:hypothetical protein